MMLWHIRYIAILLVASLLLTACQSTSISGSVKPEAVPTVDPANTDLFQAQQNYNKWCAHCHGWAGDGQPQDTITNAEKLGYHTVPRHDAEGHTWQHTDQVLFEVVKYGVQAPTNLYPMSPFDEQFSDEEIFAIITYLKQWWTDDQRQHQAALTTQFVKNNPYWEEENLTDEE